jgi:asparagine synthase (glutamine-hydrolysing)
MCGIAGFVTIDKGSSLRGVLERMTGAIAHRGPDSESFYADAGAYLGHRRLSIIDVAGGLQPMPNEDRSAWIIYNGEIFNHSAMRPELEAAGHRYGTHCDTETVIHAWEQFGPQCLDRFRGMFSFAIWDKNRETLFCARDRLGIKPFYYFWNGRVFAFASEIKALLEHPEIRAEFEEELLPEYLASGFISEERTLFKGIRKLMPGHWLRLGREHDRLQLHIERYWELPMPGEVAQRSDEEWIRECRTRLEETVEMRLMSEVPLGMFLSGGLDSSAIAALMRRMVSGPVKTFSVGYAEERYSELSYARQVSEAIGTQHHEIKVGMADFFNALPRLVWHEDEPICWPSSISLYFVSKLAAEHVKVVLTGEGSDELFAGYERYRYFSLYQKYLPAYRMLPGFARSGIRSWIGSTSLLSAGLRRKLSHTFLGREDSVQSLYLDNFLCSFSADAQQKLLRSPSKHSPYGNFLKYWDSRPNVDLLSRLLYSDQKTYLVELLMKQDQMSMACSIESRVPLLDHTFVEFASRVPNHLKIQGKGKYIFKKAVEDILPHEIIYRKKMGFPTPLRDWLRDEKADPLYRSLRDPSGFVASLTDSRELSGLLDRHRNGFEDATDRIWRLLNLQIWADRFITGRGASSEEAPLISVAS